MTESPDRYDDPDAQTARISELEAQLAAAEATAAQMREALESYAAGGNWYINRDNPTPTSLWLDGEGPEIARTALASTAGADLLAELAALRAQAERDAAVVAAAVVWVAKLDACDPAQEAEDELIAAVRMRGDAIALASAIRARNGAAGEGAK